MKEVISRDAALAALKEYNHEPFHIQHALTVEGVMRWYANELGYGEDADFWATAGLLHDIDFEMWPEQHYHHQCGRHGPGNHHPRVWRDRRRPLRFRRRRQPDRHRAQLRQLRRL